MAGVDVTGGLFDEVTEDVLGVPMRVYQNRHRSVQSLLLASAVHGDREYVVDDDHRLTFRSHLELALGFGAVLTNEYGVRQGDRVGILAANSVEWLVAFWGAASIGAVVAPMNTYWSQEEFQGALSLTGASLLIGDGRSLSRVLADQSPIPKLRLDIPDFWALAEAKAGAAPAELTADEDDPAVLVFTSGTTGLPKAVTHSHRSVCGFVQASMHNGLLRMLANPQPAAPQTSPPPQMRTLLTSPLFHVAALHGMAVTQLATGGCNVLMKGRFEPERALQTIQAERVTVWPALGSAGPRVATHPDLAKYDVSSIQVVSVGGAPCSPATQDLIRKAFPTAAVGLTMGYTSSEACAVIASTSGDEYAAHPTATGKVAHGIELEIRDESGRTVPAGVDGEIYVRSPYVMLGYWKDEKATAAVLGTDRWLAMGDAGQLKDGRLYINSRLRDLIFVSAENVFPSEVEYRLDAHPLVQESAVVGEDDAVTGQAVVAHVVADGKAPTAEELRDWCAESLAKYKIPTRWVFRTSPLPRNPTGKILKRELISRSQ